MRPASRQTRVSDRPLEGTGGGDLSRGPRAPLLRLTALALAIAVAFALVVLTVTQSPNSVRDFVDGFGAAGPLVFILIATGLTCALFPYPVIAAASGLLFGTAPGTVASILAGTTGAVAAFTIARLGGGSAVQALAGPRLARLLEVVSQRGFVAVLELRIIPGVPRDVANYACGLTGIRLRDYAAATVIGIAPRAFAYTALGGSFGNYRSTEAIVAIAMLVAVGVLGFVILIAELRRARARGG